MQIICVRILFPLPLGVDSTFCPRVLSLWINHNGVIGALNVCNRSPIEENTCVTLYRTKRLLFCNYLSHFLWICNLRLVKFIIYLVIVDIFRQNVRKNAQKVLKRLPNICTQHKCKKNSMFVYILYL